MKEFCIPKYLAENLKKAAKAGEIDIKKLYEMSSPERRAVFEKYTDKPTAQSINVGFEEAMISAQQDSLKEWAESTFKGKKKKKEYKDVLDKIGQLNVMGVLDSENQEGFLEDLVSARLGASVSKEELEKLNDFSLELEDLAKANETSRFGITLEYLQKRREVNNYIESLTPTPKTRVATGIIGRGFMLASIKSTILNIESNTIAGFLEAVTRRLASGQYMGKANSEMKEYLKFATNVYRKTGFDITRSLEMQFTPKVLGEEILSAQGSGKVRQVARVVEDVIFKASLGLPDVAFSAFHFADTANNMAALVARKEGLKGEALVKRAKELTLDAMQVIPQTDEGLKIKKKAVANAAKATYQNDSLFSKIAMSIRTMLNEVQPDLRFGDLLIPFVKTPANVLDLAFDYSIGGAAKGVINLKRAYDAKKNGDAEAFQEYSLLAKEFFIRSGLGLSFAFAIAAMVSSGSGDDDEYIGDYPTNPSDRELFALKNGVENSIRIGDKYVSLDYLGPLGIAVKGFLDAKKVGGGDPANQAIGFLGGSLSQVQNVPGFEETKNTLDSIGVFVENIKNNEGEESANRAINSVIDIVAARSIPAFVNDINKIIDPIRRDVDSKDPMQKLKSKIPGLSSQFPEKTDTVGDVQRYEEPLIQILFGSRIKTRKQDEIVKEIDRLDNEGYIPTITKFENSDRVKEMKVKLSNEKYKEMVQEFKVRLKDEWHRTLKTSSYKRLTNDEKQATLNAERADLRDRILKKYGYRKTK